MGEPFGVLTAKCGRCGGELDVYVESDGWGSLLDIVQPCPHCFAPKVVLRPLPRPKQARALVGLRRTHPMMKLAVAKARALLERGDLSATRIARLVGISSDHVRALKREMEDQ